MRKSGLSLRLSWKILTCVGAGRYATVFLYSIYSSHAFLQNDQHRFPLIFRIALDILPAQASAVPCERVFSSSKETDTLQRANLSPDVMERLQILKHLYLRRRGEGHLGKPPMLNSSNTAKESK